jgi:hypothetical protein
MPAPRTERRPLPATHPLVDSTAGKVLHYSAKDDAFLEVPVTSKILCRACWKLVTQPDRSGIGDEEEGGASQNEAVKDPSMQIGR